MIRKESDKLFRNLSKEHVEVLLQKFGIDVEIIAIHPTTGLSIDNKYLEMDFVIEIKGHKIKDLEFQTTIVTKKDQYRFLKYTVYLSEYTGMDSEVIVISSVEEPKVKILDFSEDFKYPLKIYSLKNIDGDKVLNKIKDKLSNNEKLTLDEYIDLVIMGYYNSKNPVKNIKSAIEILTSIKDETTDMEQLITFQYLMFNKFRCEYKELKEAEGLFEMRLPAFEESLRKREEKGKTEGKFDVALNMIHKKNMSVEEAAEIAEIPLNQLKEAIGY